MDFDNLHCFLLVAHRDSPDSSRWIQNLHLASIKQIRHLLNPNESDNSDPSDRRLRHVQDTHYSLFSSGNSLDAIVLLAATVWQLGVVRGADLPDGFRRQILHVRSFVAPTHGPNRIPHDSDQPTHSAHLWKRAPFRLRRKRGLVVLDGTFVLVQVLPGWNRWPQLNQKQRRLRRRTKPLDLAWKHRGHSVLLLFDVYHLDCDSEHADCNYGSHLLEARGRFARKR